MNVSFFKLPLNFKDETLMKKDSMGKKKSQKSRTKLINMSSIKSKNDERYDQVEVDVEEYNSQTPPPMFLQQSATGKVFFNRKTVKNLNFELIEKEVNQSVSH